MSATEQTAASAANAEAIEAWDGPLFERFVQFRHLLAEGLALHGNRAIELHPPQRADRVLDLGCGFGDTARQLAEIVGPEGSVSGIDASPRFIESAQQEFGAANVRFAVGDLETVRLDGPYDLAFSRFGVMFCANPVAALRNVRSALRPGGRLVVVVWRAKAENEWVYRAQQIVERFVTKPEEYDEPTCGPGPFAMANADTTSGMLVSAGYEDICLQRVDLPIVVGRDVDEAVSLVMSIGPAGEILRLAGDRAAHLHEPVAAALREGIADWATPEGVVAPASTWIVTATKPADS